MCRSSPLDRSRGIPKDNCAGIVPTQNQKVNEAVGDIGSEALASQKSGTKVPPPNKTNGTDTLVSDNGWRECKLGDVADYIARGISPKYSEIDGTVVVNQKCIRDGKINYEFTKVNDFSKKISDEKFLKQYDTLVNSTGVGTLGRVGLYDLENDKCTADSHVMIVRASGGIDKKWLFYNLFSRQDEIELLGEGSTGQIELSRLRLADLDVLLQPPKEQKAIAEVLSSLDDKIDLLHRQNHTLESLAQTLFRQWFIEEAKDEWEEKTVGDIAILKSGKSRPKEESDINNVPIYGGNGILGFTNQHNIDGETIIIGRVGA